MRADDPLPRWGNRAAGAVSMSDPTNKRAHGVEVDQYAQWVSEIEAAGAIA